jgi:urease subunit beta
VTDLDGRPMVPGEVVVGETPIQAGGEADVVLTVANMADRPIQVGSHFHFAETNRSLDFDRAAAWGRRLAIPAGTSVRFEPGIEREVGLTPLRGARAVPGLRGLARGSLDSRPAPGS